MKPSIAIPIVASIIACAPLSAQSDFEYSLNSRKGNKIIMLGDWKAADLSKWKETLDSEGIFGHGFQLLTRDKLIDDPGGIYFVLRKENIPAFEQWVRQKYGLANSARWAAIGMDNKLIVTGVQAPSAKEFDEMLMQKGVKTPQRILRDFLRENPGHIDAMTDLLTEVRRRALHVMPPNPTEDLGTEKDLLTWAVMSTETDKVFSGDWLGIDITFFRPDKVQPERYSKFMRDVFKKHISKVEQAIALNPMNGTLWNIWAWMAQCSPDYKISPFINSIEPGVYPSWNSNRTFPPRNVCAWIIEEAKAKNDWNTVVKFAKAAQYFRGAVPTGSSAKTEWSPNRITKFATGDETMKDYPARAYAAHLEALLRLGNIDEANRVYDEMIRKEGKTARFSTNIAVNGKTEWHKSENALIAANAARAVGMEDLAKIWEMGEQINKVPYVMNISDYVNGFPSWYYYAQSGKSYSDGFSALVSGLVPALRTYSAYPTIIDGVAILDPMASMGWKADDGDRWALIAGDMRAIEQGYGMPEPDTLQAMLKRHNVKDEAGYRRDYMAEHGARPGLEIDLAFTIIDSTSAAFSRRPDKGANIDKEQDVWAEACKLINKVLSENPEILINLPNTYGRGNSANSIQTPAMKALSTKLLANIEWLLEKKPSSENLWNQWLFWRWVEGSNRPIELIVESAVASPISIPGTVPPAEAMDAYYDECKKNEEWRKVISLLRVVWDREFARITDIQRTNPNFKVSAPAGNPSNFSSMAEYEAYLVQQWSAGLGDSVVIPLMEAYLHDSKPSDAKDIFDAWLGSGGTFKDISKVAELARKLGHERLAVEWEGKVKK